MVVSKEDARPRETAKKKKNRRKLKTVSGSVQTVGDRKNEEEPVPLITLQYTLLPKNLHAVSIPTVFNLTIVQNTRYVVSSAKYF